MTNVDLGYLSILTCDRCGATYDVVVDWGDTHNPDRYKRLGPMFGHIATCPDCRESKG